MTKLNLQFFAKSSSQQTEYRKKKAILKRAYEAQHEGLKNREPTSKNGFEKTGAREPGVRQDQINRNEEYVLYQIVNGKEHEYGTRSGAKLRDLIAHEDLVYKNKVYQSRKGIKYIIRRKR